jgi:hypothetical protein
VKRRMQRRFRPIAKLRQGENIRDPVAKVGDARNGSAGENDSELTAWGAAKPLPTFRETIVEEIHLAGARRLLRTLEAHPHEPLDDRLIRNWLPSDLMGQIKARTVEYRAYNKEINVNPHLLSGDAAEYWRDCQAMLRFGRRVHADDKSATQAKRLTLWCESLDESFEARVPREDQGKFMRHDLTDPSSWDDRWHACRDFEPPLLRPMSGNRIASPKASAQLDILRKLIDPTPEPANTAFADRVRKFLLRD